MKIFLLQDPVQRTKWASFVLSRPQRMSGRCVDCGAGRAKRERSLHVYWQKGSDHLGDFSWSAYDYLFAANERLRGHAETHAWGCRFSPLIVEPPPRTEGPGHKGRRIRYPYEGPALWWCDVQEIVKLNIEASGIKAQKCGSCGYLRYDFKARNLVIQRDHWKNQPIFRLFPESEAVFVTESQRSLLAGANLSNWSAVEAGSIL